MSTALAIPPPALTRRIVDAVHEALRAAILGGDLEPGAPLSVPELSRRMNVSRSPVREAVLQLVADGLAVEQPRKGVVVAALAPGDVAEIHEIRMVLEALAARLAARHLARADLAALASVLETQAQAVETGNAALYSRTNGRFHRILADHCGNVRLKAFLLRLESQMLLALKKVAAEPSHLEQGYREHLAILAALEAGDADAAEAAMRRHIANTREASERANRHT